MGANGTAKAPLSIHLSAKDLLNDSGFLKRDFSSFLLYSLSSGHCAVSKHFSCVSPTYDMRCLVKD